MRVSRLFIEDFRGIKKAELHFSGHSTAAARVSPDKRPPS
jgi:hypothetical protein